MIQERYINPYTDFTKLFEQAEIARFSPQDLLAYEESVKVYRDLNNVVSTAERKGREEGREEERFAIARNLKAMGMAADDIAKATGLTIEEITLI